MFSYVLSLNRFSFERFPTARYITKESKFKQGCILMYILKKINFLPYCKIFHFFPLVFSPMRGKNIKVFSRYPLLYSLFIPIPHISLVFSPRKGEKFENVYSNLIFVYFFHASYIFFF